VAATDNPTPEGNRGGVVDTRDPALVVLKIGGTIGLLCVVALGITWTALALLPPDPAEVCSHKLELATRDTAKQDPETVALLLDSMRLNCIHEKKRRIQLRGKIAYWRYATCVLEATTFDDAERC